MMSLSGRWNDHPKYAKALEWGKLVALTGFAQTFVQILGLVSGILIIRFLPTSEYALYTLANTMLATICTIADGGIGAGILASGGKVWADREALGKVIVTGIKLRQHFSIFVLALSLPVLIFLLNRYSASWMMAIGIVAAIIPAFYAAVSDTLFEIPLKLNQEIRSLQKNQVLANCARFILLTSSIVFFPFTFIAMLSGGITRLWANIKLRKMAGKFADFSQGQDAAVKKKMYSMLKRTMPVALYYCASTQISIWLLSIFGNASSIASAGALERIASVLNIVSVIFATLIVPRFARLSEGPKLLRLKFIQILGLLLVISCIICMSAYVFSEQVLFILGKNYAHLNWQLVLVMMAGCFTMMAGVSHNLSVARGWALSPIIYISVSILVQLLLIRFTDLSVLTNVLIVGVMNAATGFMIHSIYFFYRIGK